MDYLPTSLLSLLWIGLAAAQENINETAEVVSQVPISTDPLIHILSNGGITLPSALIIIVMLLLRSLKDWQPTIKLELTHGETIKVRLIEPRRPSE